MTRPRKPDPIPPADAAVLRHAGLLGHAYVLIVTRTIQETPLEPGAIYRDKAYESCDRERSKKLATDAYADRAPALYQQVSRGVWRAVKLP